MYHIPENCDFCIYILILQQSEKTGQDIPEETKEQRSNANDDWQFFNDN